MSRLSNVGKSSYSPVHRIVIAGLCLTFITALLSVAYGWSLEETERMMRAIVGPDYALLASLIIQIGPQPLLILSAMTRREKYNNVWEFLLSTSGMVFVVAIGLNLVDMLTNNFAFNDWYGTYTGDDLLPETRALAKPLGHFLASFVTWSEELSAIIFAMALEHIRQARADLGLSSPKWMTWDVAGLARQAGTGQPSKPSQQAQAAPQSQQNERREQPEQRRI